MNKVTDLIPRDAVIIPNPSSQNWLQAQIVAGSIGAGVLPSDPALKDEEIISAYRCYSIIYHLARNGLLRAGVDESKLDKIASDAVLTRQARDKCIQQSTVANANKAEGISFDKLCPENRVDFFLGAAAMLADIQDEFHRRGLMDPDDPRKSLQ